MIVPRSSAKPHHRLHSVQFASSWPAMSGCCVWAQFNFSPLSLSPFQLSRAGLSSAKAQLSWPYKVWLLFSSWISWYILFKIIFFSAQFSSVQFSLSNSAQLSLAGPTRSDYGVLISSYLLFFNSIFFNSAQLKSSFPAQLSWSWFQLAPQGLTAECWSAHATLQFHNPGFLFLHTLTQFHAVWEKKGGLGEFLDIFFQTQVRLSICEIKITPYCYGFVCFQIWVKCHPVFPVRFPNPLPSQCSYALIFRSGVRRLRRWSSTQSAAFLKPVPASDCLLHTKYADLLTLCSISS